MIQRTLKQPILERAAKLPVITITGPRQSGKTTLAKSLFSHYVYRNLEYPDVRQFAIEDPRGFLENAGAGIIIDEIQRVPQLLSYIQGIVDEQHSPGKFILTGSQNLLLARSVSQSLAGRSAIFNLLPFSIEELAAANLLTNDLEPVIYQGFYPRLYNNNLRPDEWIPSYVATYVERDVRDVTNIHSLTQFQTFLRLCAGRIGQVLNLASLGNDCGVDQKTVRSWISVLEATFIVFLLPPFHRNFNKRLTKSPKLYFYDTGLACWLLGIRSPEDLVTHYSRGSLFENMILGELVKYNLHRGKQSDLYFWRESNGNEVDCVYDCNGQLHAIECKSGRTVSSDFFSGLSHLNKISDNTLASQTVVYGGAETQHRTAASVVPWNKIAEMMKEKNDWQ